MNPTSLDDEFREVVAQLRSWGVPVVEWSGCYGRSNGGSWSDGQPIGHLNHHYVCSLNPDQVYINGLVEHLADGKVVNWFADVNGKAYLIGTGPMNHSGTGMSSVRDRTRAGQPPTGPASSAGDISGNSWYSGTECQHPGDSTPWPQPLLDTMVAINAAEFLTWGYSSARAINHYEWTSRKIDMSAGGGTGSGGWAGQELRRRVAARMEGDDDMPLSADDKAWITETVRATVWELLAKDLLSSTEDEAADGNPNKYTIASGIARTIRLSSLTYTGQQGEPHPG